MTREDAIKRLKLWLICSEDYTEDDVSMNEAIRIAINSLEQEPKTGHWIKDSPFAKPYCSECGNSCFGVHGFNYTISPYCPNCGAKMQEESEDK